METQEAQEKHRLAALEDWSRIERIIETTNLSVNAFALHIGLPRGENLYQIRRGNNRISRGLAERIHTHYPMFGEHWIHTGRGSALDPDYQISATDLDPKTAVEICLRMLGVLQNQVKGKE